MPRPVEGFLSFDGRYFPTEGECETYEATLDAVNATREGVNKLMPNLGEAGTTFVTDFLLDFFNENFPALDRFHKTFPKYRTQQFDIRQPEDLETHVDPPQTEEDEDLPILPNPPDPPIPDDKDISV